jgi:hypothetical protein
MHYALFYVLFLLTGQPLTDGNVFKTKAECEEVLAKLPDLIAAHNADADNPIKITHYAAGCVKLEKAPQGKAV